MAVVLRKWERGGELIYNEVDNIYPLRKRGTAEKEAAGTMRGPAAASLGLLLLCF